MNPFRKIRQYNEARKRLKRAGYKGDLLEMVEDALQVNLELAEAVQRVQGQSGADAAAGRTYFVPFLFEATEHFNGGPVKSGSGMTMVTVGGGIRSWQEIQNVTQFVQKQVLETEQLPNAKVTLLGFSEVPTV